MPCLRQYQVIHWDIFWIHKVMATKRRKLSTDQHYEELKQQGIVANEPAKLRRKKKLESQRTIQIKALYFRMCSMPLFDPQLVRFIIGFLPDIRVGTILCGIPHMAGASRYWEFVEVRKVTPTGCVVVQPIRTDSKQLDFGLWGSNTQMKPIPHSFFSSSFLLKPDLHRRKLPQVFFDVYQANETYINHFSNGD